MIHTKKHAGKLILLSSLFCINSFSAPDEYLNENISSEGKTQAMAGKTVGLAKKTAEVVVIVSKSIYDTIISADYEHEVEIGSQADRRFIRYEVETELSSSEDPTMTFDWIPVRINLEASDEEGITLREARIAVAEVTTKWGISLSAIDLKQGESDTFSPNLFNQDHKQLDWFGVDYTDTLWSSQNDSHKIILNAYFDWKIDEKIVNEAINRKYTYVDGNEFGASLGYQYDSPYGKFIPEVGYRKSSASSYSDDDRPGSENEGYSAERAFIQLVFKKNIFNKNCKFSVGVASESYSGDFANIDDEDEEYYAKGKCKF